MYPVKLNAVLNLFSKDDNIEEHISSIEYGEGGDYFILNLECYDHEIEEVISIKAMLFLDDGLYFELSSNTEIEHSLNVSSDVVDLLHEIKSIWTSFTESAILEEKADELEQ